MREELLALFELSELKKYMTAEELAGLSGTGVSGSGVTGTGVSGTGVSGSGAAEGSH
jgi:hypothetical protein